MLLSVSTKPVVVVASFQSKLIVGGCDLCHRHVILGKTCKQCKFQTKLVVGSCDLCHKQVFRGKVCKYCKLKFHRDCAAKAAPACGLPSTLVDIFLDTLRRDGSPTVSRANHSPSLQSNEPSLLATHSTPDSSSSTSSCNSSTPSSPALYSSSCPVPHSPALQQPSPQIQIIPDSDSQFKFPDVSPMNNLDQMTVDSIGTIGSLDVDSLPSRGYYSGDFVSTSTSNDSDRSDRTLTGSLSSSERTALLERGDSMDNGDDPGGQSWQRANSISIALREWDIPFEELIIGDKIGSGRFGTVHKGNWHGDVAIKMLNMETNLDHQAQLQAFKLEVAMLRKTRHENLVLFMGACMKQPHLAVITSLCKGHTLYTHIHMRKERFQMNRTVIIASQVAQGMGYLHAKGIIHKDLKSRNIFLESGKVVITDFGLSNVTKLCHGNRKGEYLSIPEGWLCYLSPEIIRRLQAGAQYQEIELPFTEASDIFAFGTVWYELLSGEWPFKTLSPEAIIWQIGKGMKQSLSHIQASRDVKDVLMLCWAYASHDRPDFRILLKHLERLPKKRLARSPSHPIQLSRSAESVF
ncbi:hypothetical protein NP493_165g04028 [Ridgeia piscesae]|uniref:Kinase suppressor of Ras 2 n=1 Tax=Ridgeia piscesae TaxID=27915 RepID=A0AAD9UFD5_RIDPI|nr:hypothetical protein NP493_165g04028 [Ridgeia piscesae]